MILHQNIEQHPGMVGIPPPNSVDNQCLQLLLEASAHRLVRIETGLAPTAKVPLCHLAMMIRTLCNPFLWVVLAAQLQRELVHFQITDL